MSESFLFAVAGKILWKLGSIPFKQVSLLWGIDNDLQKLERTLSTIQAVLLDAEEQQGKSHQLSNWLENLKDIVYDIDDVIDEFEIVAIKRQVIHGRIKTKVCNFFSCSNPLAFRVQMGYKIKEVRERLDEIAADKTKFNLAERFLDAHVQEREREMIYSFVLASDVIGRDKEKDDIVQDLMTSSDRENISVIPIVGIGGLGKTTLAQMVYNDDRIVEHFELRIWVCVSDDFDMKKVIKKIIKSATNMNCHDLDINQLQNYLRNILHGRKYLLILDDVWNEDRAKWNDLRGLLMGGANGSKVIVTTRNDSVASIMGTTSCNRLKGLPDEDCLSLFLKWAFREGEDLKQHQNLVKIGSEIVKKCIGVPLAVRTLGRLLYMKTDERDWSYVRDNEIWKIEQKHDDILPALKLSYDLLPPYLKQCFAFCSIFAKDTEFNSTGLINLWMAEGFIHSSDQNQELEFIGEKYIKELSSRSFFQEVEDFGIFLKFKMHDLVHDLSVSVAKTECAIVNSHAQSISKMVRHVSYSDGNLLEKEVPSCLLGLKNLRTIYFPFDGVGPTSKSFVETCISQFKRLRVLDLHGSCFPALPSSIGGLKQLRYLTLLGNSEIKSLPNSICKLQSLQSLELAGCVKLRNLPKNIGMLISLRCLLLTTQERSLPEKGIGSLTSLRYLSLVECRNLEYFWSDHGMQRFTALRTLSIKDCASLASLPEGMRYLTTLENLVIDNCEKLNLTLDDQDEVEAEDLSFQRGGGLRSLRYLAIKNLPNLVALPQWLFQGTSANSLKHITIAYCPNLTTLMPERMLENLKSLKKLWIFGCPRLMSLPEEMHCLITLREIHILRCPELVRRCRRERGENWNQIAHVPDIYLDGVKI